MRGQRVDAALHQVAAGPVEDQVGARPSDSLA